MTSNGFLECNSPVPLVVKIDGLQVSARKVRIITPYANYRVEVTPSSSGHPEAWATLQTRPAFEVAMLRKAQKGLTILLMRKQRHSGEAMKTKVPGGYLRGTFQDYGPKKVLDDTGFLFKLESVVEVKPVIGHAEICTPIRLFYTFDFQKALAPQRGIEVLEVTLDEAVDMAVNNLLENDSSFHLVMKLFYLQQKGQLA